MQDKEGIILITGSNGGNWGRWIHDHTRSVRIVCKVEISRL